MQGDDGKLVIAGDTRFMKGELYLVCVLTDKQAHKLELMVTKTKQSAGQYLGNFGRKGIGDNTYWIPDRCRHFLEEGCYHETIPIAGQAGPEGRTLCNIAKEEIEFAEAHGFERCKTYRMYLAPKGISEDDTLLPGEAPFYRTGSKQVRSLTSAPGNPKGFALVDKLVTMQDQPASQRHVMARSGYIYDNDTGVWCKDGDHRLRHHIWGGRHINMLQSGWQKVPEGGWPTNSLGQILPLKRIAVMDLDKRMFVVYIDTETTVVDILNAIQKWGCPYGMRFVRPWLEIHGKAGVVKGDDTVYEHMADRDVCYSFLPPYGRRSGDDELFWDLQRLSEDLNTSTINRLHTSAVFVCWPQPQRLTSTSRRFPPTEICGKGLPSKYWRLDRVQIHELCLQRRGITCKYCVICKTRVWPGSMFCSRQCCLKDLSVSESTGSSAMQRHVEEAKKKILKGVMEGRMVVDVHLSSLYDLPTRETNATAEAAAGKEALSSKKEACMTECEDSDGTPTTQCYDSEDSEGMDMDQSYSLEAVTQNLNSVMQLARTTRVSLAVVHATLATKPKGGNATHEIDQHAPLQSLPAAREECELKNIRLQQRTVRTALIKVVEASIRLKRQASDLKKESDLLELRDQERLTRIKRLRGPDERSAPPRKKEMQILVRDCNGQLHTLLVPDKITVGELLAKARARGIPTPPDDLIYVRVGSSQCAADQQLEGKLSEGMQVEYNLRLRGGMEGTRGQQARAANAAGSAAVIADEASNAEASTNTSNERISSELEAMRQQSARIEASTQELTDKFAGTVGDLRTHLAERDARAQLAATAAAEQLAKAEQRRAEERAKQVAALRAETTKVQQEAASRQAELRVAAGARQALMDKRLLERDQRNRKQQEDLSRALTDMTTGQNQMAGIITGMEERMNAQIQVDRDLAQRLQANRGRATQGMSSSASVPAGGGVFGQAASAAAAAGAARQQGASNAQSFIAQQGSMAFNATDGYQRTGGNRASQNEIADDKHIADAIYTGKRVGAHGPLKNGDLHYSDIVTPLLTEAATKVMEARAGCIGPGAELLAPVEGTATTAPVPLGRAKSLTNVYRLMRRRCSIVHTGGVSVSAEHIADALQHSTFTLSMARHALGGGVGGVSYAWSPIGSGIKYLINGESTHLPTTKGKRKPNPDFGEMERITLVLNHKAWSPETLPTPANMSVADTKIFRLFVGQREKEENELIRRQFIVAAAVRRKYGGAKGTTACLRYLAAYWVLRQHFGIANVNPNSDLFDRLGGAAGTAIDYLLSRKQPTTQ